MCREDLPDRGTPRQLGPHRVLGRHLCLGKSEHFDGSGRGYDDDPVVIAEDQVAVVHGHTAAFDRLADLVDVDSAERIFGADACHNRFIYASAKEENPA